MHARQVEAGGAVAHLAALGERIETFRDVALDRRIHRLADHYETRVEAAVGIVQVTAAFVIFVSLLRVAFVVRRRFALAQEAVMAELQAALAVAVIIAI